MNEELEKDIEALIIARLNEIPSHLELAVGGEGPFTIEDLKHHVRENDDIGKMFIESELSYLRSLGDLPIDEESLSDYTGQRG